MTQEPQAALLRACVRALVRQHLPGLRCDRHRRGEPLARASDAVGACVVLRHPPVRLRLVSQNTVLPPGGEVPRSVLDRVRQRQVDDVVPSPRPVLGSCVGDDVVRRGDERVERAGPPGRTGCSERAESGAPAEWRDPPLAAAAAWADEVGPPSASQRPTPCCRHLGERRGGDGLTWPSPRCRSLAGEGPASGARRGLRGRQLAARSRSSRAAVPTLVAAKRAGGRPGRRRGARPRP